MIEAMLAMGYSSSLPTRDLPCLERQLFDIALGAGGTVMRNNIDLTAGSFYHPRVNHFPI